MPACRLGRVSRFAAVNPGRFEIDPDTLAAALNRLILEDAVSLPLLGPEDRATLLEAAEALPYRRATPTIGEGDKQVTQDFELTVAFQPGDVFHQLAEALEQLTAAALTRAATSLLPTAPSFNDLIVQRYTPGSRGITPHRDHICYTGIVALVTLCGRAKFFLCPDRSGRNARELPMPPGGLILMRAPGFAGLKDRPFHMLSHVEETRIGVGIRHDTRKAETGKES